MSTEDETESAFILKEHLKAHHETELANPINDECTCSSTELHLATMKVEDAARFLGIGRQTAYQLAREGKLPGARRLGGRIIVSKKMLAAFLEGDCQESL